MGTPTVVNVAKIIGEYLGVFTEEGEFKVANNDLSDNKLEFVAESKYGVFVTDGSGTGNRVKSCLLSAEDGAKYALRCKDMEGDTSYSVYSDFGIDKIKIKIALAVVGEKVGDQFLKENSSEIEKLKAMLEGRLPKTEKPDAGKPFGERARPVQP